MFKKKKKEMSRSWSGSTGTSSSSAASSRTAPTVLAVECISSGDATQCSGGGGGTLHTGDIVEEIQIGNQLLRSPFKDGTPGVQKLLKRCFRDRQTSITVRVRRADGGGGGSEMQAFIVESGSGGKTQYVLRGVDDPQLAVSFSDRTEAECSQIQAPSKSRTGVHHALHNADLKDGYVPYPWDRRMHGFLKVPNSSSFLSIIFFPNASSDPRAPRYNDIDNTLARANAWLNASQASGVPVAFTNIQTEPFLTKISEDSGSSSANVSSLSDLSNVANASLYGFEDYHGIDIGIFRAVRLWYSPVTGEHRVTVDIRDGDTKLGFAISRTEEGFIYIISVIEGDEDGPSARSGLTSLHKDATEAGKLLVISRINNQTVLPWLVSSSGAIRCFDTVSLSQKLSLHHHAGVPLLIHVFKWDTPSAIPAATPPPPLQRRHDADGETGLYEPDLLQEQEEGCYPQDSVQDEEDNDDDDAIQVRALGRGSDARDASFRFEYLQNTNSWA